jgi:hypothetical protein
MQTLTYESQNSTRQKLIANGCIKPASSGKSVDFLLKAVEDLKRTVAEIKAEQHKTFATIRQRYLDLLDLLAEIDDRSFASHQKPQPQYVVFLAMKYVTFIKDAIEFKEKYLVKKNILFRNGFFCSLKESMRNNP